MPKVIVYIKRGMVWDVVWNTPGTEVHIIDFDTEDFSDGDLDIVQYEGEERYCHYLPSAGVLVPDLEELLPR